MPSKDGKADMDDLLKRLAKSKATISITLRALTSIVPKAAASSGSAAPNDLPAQLRSLLTSFRHSTTSLALSFKPPLTVPAALQQLDKFIAELCQAASCVIALAEASEGAGVMLDEWRDGIMDVCTESERFLGVLAETASSGSTASSSGSNQADPYLHHTALLWDILDKLIATLPSTEAEAVVKRWKADTAVVRDAWTEFKESIEDMEVSDEKKDKKVDHEDEDDWDGAGLMGSDTISPEEQRTVEALPSDDQIKPLLQLYQLLHAALAKYIPSFPLPTSSRALLAASQTYANSFDELICALYPDHSAEAIREALNEMEYSAKAVIDIGKKGDEEVRTFLNKWMERVKREREKWDERAFAFTGLGDQLAT